MADPVQEEIDKEVATHKILIYGKGTKQMPMCGLRQDVDEFKRVPVLVEKLYRLPREPTHRHRFRALAVNQNLVRGDFLVNFFLNWICHGSAS